MTAPSILPLIEGRRQKSWERRLRDCPGGRCCPAKPRSLQMIQTRKVLDGGGLTGVDSSPNEHHIRGCTVSTKVAFLRKTPLGYNILARCLYWNPVSYDAGTSPSSADHLTISLSAQKKGGETVETRSCISRLAAEVQNEGAHKMIYWEIRRHASPVRRPSCHF